MIKEKEDCKKYIIDRLLEYKNGVSHALIIEISEFGYNINVEIRSKYAWKFIKITFCCLFDDTYEIINHYETQIEDIDTIDLVIEKYLLLCL